MPTFEYVPSRGRFRKWVLTVALNEVRQVIRKEAAEKRNFGSEQASSEAMAELSDETAIESWWRSAEAARILHIACGRLQTEVYPETYSIFQSLVIEGIPPDEVARKHDKPRNAIYGIKFRLLGRLRDIARVISGEWDD